MSLQIYRVKFSLVKTSSLGKKKSSIFPFKVSFGKEADRQAIEYRLKKMRFSVYLDVDLKQTETNPKRSP